MQQVIYILIFLFSIGWVNTALANPDEPPAPKMVSPDRSNPTPTKPVHRKYNQYKKYLNNAEKLYNLLDLSKAKTHLKKEVFTVAYLGFQNLVLEGKVSPDNHLLSIIDFSLSSKVPRLWVIDLASKKLYYNTLVAHGEGSGEEFATSFSNIDNSHQSSLGFYITDQTYSGKNGYSLKLIGMDPGYNSYAYERAIVIHGADYVNQEFINNNNRLGRSWGCPALSHDISPAIIDRIKDGSVLYIYYPDMAYLNSSKWINTTIPTGTNDVYLGDIAKKKNNNPQSTDTIQKNIQTPTVGLQTEKK